MGLHIQQSVARTRVGISEIPLDAIFNDKIDAIKSFERRNGKNPAPIKLSMWKDF